MAQQTAMQQAISHYEKLSERGSDQAWLIAEYLKENYLELEKEQIMNAFLEGKINHDKDWAIEYYNETYNK
jgi:lipopolysaccharide biosynthesis regulator YciM